MARDDLRIEVGHLGTKDLVNHAAILAQKYYDTDERKYLDCPEFFEYMREAIRRMSIQDVGQYPNADYDFEELAVDVIYDVMKPIINRRVELRFLFPYFKKIYLIHVERWVASYKWQFAYAEERLFTDMMGIYEDSIDLEWPSNDFDPTDLVSVRDDCRELARIMHDMLKQYPYLGSNRRLLVPLLVLSVIRKSNAMLHRYEFRTRVILRGIVYEGQKHYERVMQRRYNGYKS